MRIHIAFAALAVALTLTTARTFADGGDDWLPAKEGARWTYERQTVTDVAGMHVVQKQGSVTCVCKGTEKVGDRDCAVLVWTAKDEAGADAGEARIVVRSAGATVIVERSTSNELWVVPADLEKKKETVTVESESGKCTVQSSCEGEEQVEVPAGKFTATKVVARVEAGGATVTRTVWFAKGTGIVKIVKHVETAGVVADQEYVLTKHEKG